MEETINRYIEFRTTGQYEECLNLCTSDIIINSPRDGIHSGIDAVREYFKECKPANITWDPPQKTGVDTVTINGTMYVFFIPIGIKTVCTVEGKKISQIVICNKGLAVL